MQNSYRNENNKIKIDNRTIKVVDHYIYLGQILAMDSIKRWITMGWRSFICASSIFRNPDIQIIQIHQVYNQCITPTDCGAETSNLAKRKTWMFLSKHKKSILGAKWYHKNYFFNIVNIIMINITNNN